MDEIKKLKKQTYLGLILMISGAILSNWNPFVGFLFVLPGLIFILRASKKLKRLRSNDPTKNIPSADPRRFELLNWVFWISMLVPMFVYQFTLGKGLSLGADQGTPNMTAAILAVGFVFFSALLRWVVLPKVSSPMAMLFLLMFGCALAESAEFFQIFLINSQHPRAKLELFLLSIVGMAIWMPVYAKRFRAARPAQTGEASLQPSTNN